MAVETTGLDGVFTRVHGPSCLGDEGAGAGEIKSRELGAGSAIGVVAIGATALSACCAGLAFDRERGRVERRIGVTVFSEVD